MKGKAFKRTIGILMLFALVFTMVGVYDGGKTAKAADETTTSVWSGEQAMVEGETNIGVGGASFEGYSSISEVTITYSITNTEDYYCSFFYNGWNWVGLTSGTNESTLVPTSDQLEGMKTGGINVQGSNITITDISDTGVKSDDYSPYFRTKFNWSNEKVLQVEESGTYEITYTDLGIESFNSSNVDFSFTCANPGSLAGKGFKLDSITINDTEYTGTSDLWSVSEFSSAINDTLFNTWGDNFGILGEFGGSYSSTANRMVLENDIAINNVGVKFTIMDYIPGELYTQKTDVSGGVYSQRWVCLVSEDDLASTKNATFTITRASDSKKLTKTVTTAYKSISASGDAISFDGYYWVCYSLTGIPEGVTLTGAIELN